MLDFVTLPPEMSSARMYTGPGSGPMMASASAWDALAAQLASFATGYESVLSGLQGQNWSGGAAAAMATAATPYVEWVTATAAKVEEAAVRARAAAGAYETAHAAIVPPALVAVNRAELANLVATNVFGQNAALIAAVEGAYAEMWARNTHAMYGYAASASAAAKLSPFTEPPQTTNAAGQSGQAAAVVQAAGAGGSAASGSVVTAASTFNTLTGPAGFGEAASRTVTSAGSFGFGVYRSILQSQGAIAKALTEPLSELPIGPATTGAVKLSSASARGAVLASVGRAESVGGLSVPQRWAPAPPVATAVEEPMRLSQMYSGTGSALAENPATGMSGGAPAAAMGPMAGMVGRPTVSGVLRVEPRRFKMPRPAVGG